MPSKNKQGLLSDNVCCRTQICLAPNHSRTRRTVHETRRLSFFAHYLYFKKIDVINLRCLSPCHSILLHSELRPQEEKDRGTHSLFFAATAENRLASHQERAKSESGTLEVFLNEDNTTLEGKVSLALPSTGPRSKLSKFIKQLFKSYSRSFATQQPPPTTTNSLPANTRVISITASHHYNKLAARICVCVRLCISVGFSAQRNGEKVLTSVLIASPTCSKGCERPTLADRPPRTIEAHLL